MNKKIKIKLDYFSLLKKFAAEVVKFESDINVMRGKVIYDAKSIIAVLSLDPSSSVFVEIISDNEDEIRRFNEVMEEFMVD